MSTKNYQRNGILTRLLRVLVDEYGHETVALKLHELEASRDAVSGRDANKNERASVRKLRRPSGMHAMVDALDVDDPKKAFLQVIASRFDEKTFLPSVGDARHFIEMRGEQARMKQRSDAMRPVLRALLTMTAEGLEKLATADIHSGPSRLGPLADAIRETGAAMRSARSSIEVDAEEPLKETGREGASTLPDQSAVEKLDNHAGKPSGLDEATGDKSVPRTDD